MLTNYKLVKTYNSELNARLDLINLKDAGLNVHLEDVNTVYIAPYYSNAIGGIKLIVRKEDYNQAVSILSRGKAPESELGELFDEYEPAIKCPKCQSHNIVQNNSIIAGLLFLIWCFVPVAVPKNQYKCLDCDNNWKSKERYN